MRGNSTEARFSFRANRSERPEQQDIILGAIRFSVAGGPKAELVKFRNIVIFFVRLDV